MKGEFTHKTEPAINYYYSLKNVQPALYVAAHNDFKTTYSTSRGDAKLFKGWGPGDNQPLLETHDIWQHTETTEYTHKLLDVSELSKTEGK
ncbi:hypothetical protein [Macrococcus brunensis]|uniref:hypothetical protein n=1 Tax=Macrococcus brunensis TaxID=198483 RepID=UPI001EF0F7B0|nr:hypothetical protein [Macrococcus brunensis]ULG73190.1 hypothetical protein MGG13_05550 [Macrococcus brunensis]